MSSPNSSPRLSFSNDLNPSDLPSPPCKPRNRSSSSSFDFSVGFDTILPQDPVPADEIFSGGKILPLPLKNPNPAPDATTVAKKSSWRFGRSNSLNLGGRRRIKLFRSKSAGSGPSPVGNPSPKPPRLTKKRSMAMSPVVPYFPKEGNGMGVIGFLLCSCGGGGGGGGKRMDYY